MKKLLKKMMTASDKTVVTIAVAFATLATAWTLAIAEDITFEIVALVAMNAWLIIEAVHFEED